MSEFIGVYMIDGIPIEIREDMPREQMWVVLRRLATENREIRKRHREDFDAIMVLSQ